MLGITCAFTGRCGGDAELRHTSAGTAKTTISVAVDDYQRGKEMTEQSPTWVKVTVWASDAEQYLDQLRKGVEIYAEGRLRLEVWTGKDGEPHSTLAVSVSRIEVLGRIGRMVQPTAPVLMHEVGMTDNDEQKVTV